MRHIGYSKGEDKGKVLQEKECERRWRESWFLGEKVSVVIQTFSVPLSFKNKSVDIALSNIFLYIFPWARETKEKINK